MEDEEEDALWLWGFAKAIRSYYEDSLKLSLNTYNFFIKSEKKLQNTGWWKESDEISLARWGLCVLQILSKVSTGSGLFSIVYKLVSIYKKIKIDFNSFKYYFILKVRKRFDSSRRTIQPSTHTCDAHNASSWHVSEEEGK